MSRRFYPAWLLLLCAWGPLLWLLSLYWRSDAQYHYGWLLPPVAAFLLWQRRGDRPAPGPASQTLAWNGLAVGLLIFAPLWLVLGANTDWRPLVWLLAASVLLVTFALLELHGGATWRRHFGFPVLLILAAIPWPSVLETFVVHNLMFLVADLTVLVLDLLGVPARQAGILIETRHGMVGIEEACSGVRSLQAALTAALVFGELYRLPLLHRGALAGLAFAAALAFNLLRAVILTVAASRGGAEAVHRFHDPAGFTILSACLLLLWWAVTQMQTREPLTVPSGHAPVRRVRSAPSLVGAGWLVLVLAVTESWYARAENSRDAALRVRWPKDAAAFAFDELSPETRAEIGSDIAESAHWTDAEGRFWMVFYFNWLPGTDTGQLLARQHRPEICLPSVGTTLVAEREPITVPEITEPVQFRAYTFDRYGRSLHVYFTRWEQTPLRGRSRSGSGSIQHDRIRSVFEGRRRFGQQIVEIALAGAESADEADRLVKEALPQLLEVKPVTVP